MNLSGLRNDTTRRLAQQSSLSTTSLALSGNSNLPEVYGSETDPIFTAWDRTTGITITVAQISPAIIFPVTLAGTETLINKTLTSPLGLVKADVGLSNVDNTTDMSKPLSTAIIAALALKEVLTNKSTNVITDGASDIKYPSVKAVKTYVDANILTVVAHNNTTSKQGGVATEYYHLTNAQHTIAIQTATTARAGYLSAADWNAFSAGSAAIADGDKGDVVVSAGGTVWTLTAADVLTRLLTVDGTGTLLDADKLDGHEGSYFEVANANIQSHISNNNQAHTDYLKNDANDSSTGELTAVNFILSSDERLKQNIKPIEPEEIKIEYKQFELKSEPKQLRYGVIAQELQKTNPELIRVDENGMLSVAYIDLLIKEIAWLKSKIK